MTVINKLEAAFWTLLAGALVFYGTGEFDLVTLMLYDKRLNRPFINIALASAASNVAIFVYLNVWLEAIKGHSQPEASVAKWAIPAGGTTMSVAVVSFIIGLWPIFGFISILLVVVVMYGFVMSLNFLPTFGLLKVGKPTSTKQE